jgi:23S rRNA (uracil1939-C5)-methyltransferase
MEFSFSDTRWLTPDELKSSKIYPNQNIFLGLHAKGFYDKIVDIQECHLMDNIYPIIAAVRQMAKKSKLPAYNNRTHTGLFRFLVIRKSEHFDELMVNLVVRDYDASLFELYKTEMLKYPQITSLVANTTASKANVAFGEKEYLISGNATIKDKIGSLIFEISSGSFFQTNTQQAEHLYNIVLEYASLTGKEIVYDFYSGAGTISLFISHLAKQVIGFESVADAVDDANRNKQRNNIENCTFVHGDLLQLIKDVKSITLKYGIPDVIITDPPRAGMHPKTLQSILLLNPKRIVHVSCNPATLARDVAILCEKEYKLSKIKPVDMFPHTAHIEVVALLEKKHA